MATIRSEIKTRAGASEVWAAIRDIGALHTRLVPGFVADTKLEPGARVVTFVNGVTLREPIVTLDDEARRLVWTHEGGRARHYNGALEVSEAAGGLNIAFSHGLGGKRALGGIAPPKWEVGREKRRPTGRRSA